jgi:hypothetical protein
MRLAVNSVNVQAPLESGGTLEKKPRVRNLQLFKAGQQAIMVLGIGHVLFP